jgi:hypothetical protein
MRGYSFFGCQQFSIFIFASDGSLWGLLLLWTRYETLTASNQKSYLLEACIRFKKTIIFSFHGTTRQLI